MNDLLDIAPQDNSERAHKEMKTALFLLVGLVCYQFVLCFLNTNVFGVSNAIVALTEALLLALVALHVVRSSSFNEIGFVLLGVVYFIILWTVRGETDLAGPRNIAIIFLAYALGRLLPQRDVANKIVWVISGIVLFWAAIEYFFTDTYLHYFNILHYYIARGEVSPIIPKWVKQDTFVSGVRPGGRNLLPFLGDLRVSSVFLEPVSMGNYAIILAMWALSFDIKDRRIAIGHFIVAITLIVASDSRFASILLLFLVLVRLIPLTQKKTVLVVMPLVTLGGLVAMVSTGLGDPAQDNLPGRLARSGQAILDMTLPQAIGFGVPDPLPDMGIAYSIEHFGLFLCVLLWMALAIPQLVNPQAQRYRLMLAIYCLGILAVSGTSFFSTKTAPLVWFLYGVLCAKLPHEEKQL